MADLITVDVFNHLVSLAALELDAEQAEYLRTELNHQLKAIQELEAIPLDADLPANLHGVDFAAGICPAFRDDVWEKYPHPSEILDQAPQVEERYIVVPDIPHTTLK